MHKTNKYKIVYGYRIDLYTMELEYIMSLELQEGKNNTLKNLEHYEAIAVKANKSIPQIKRDFTATFRNGEAYLKVSANLFQQPSYHARKILELLDLYEPEILDKILAYAIEHEKLDIKSIKLLIKNNFFEIVAENKEAAVTINVTDIDGITRSCDYYDEIKEVTSI